MLRKVLLPIFSVYAAIVFTTGLVIIFTPCLLLSFFDAFWSRMAIFRIIEGWSRITLFLTGMPLKVTGQSPPGRYVVTSNHSSYLDAANVFSARPAYFNALGKIEL